MQRSYSRTTTRSFRVKVFQQNHLVEPRVKVLNSNFARWFKMKRLSIFFLWRHVRSFWYYGFIRVRWSAFEIFWEIIQLKSIVSCSNSYHYAVYAEPIWSNSAALSLRESSIMTLLIANCNTHVSDRSIFMPPGDEQYTQITWSWIVISRMPRITLLSRHETVASNNPM